MKYFLIAVACICGVVGANWFQHPAEAATQLILNGGFEAGQSPWQEVTTPGQQLIASGTVHSGAAAAKLCGVDSCNHQLYQIVQLPTSFSSLTLTYWYDIQSQDMSLTCNDSFRSAIATTAGTAITIPQKSCNTSRTSGWVSKTANLTAALQPYAGTKVVVYFQGKTNASAPSTFFVDDVALNASSTINPTATPTRTPSPVPTSTSPPDNNCTGNSTESACMSYMLSILNSDRATHGVALLTLNTTESYGTGSCVGSYGHSVHMAQMGQISHDQFPGDICIPYMIAGENVGEANTGSETNDLQTIDNLMMSEPYSPGCTDNHACNILNSSFHQVGIGIDRDTYGTTWLTEDFTN